MGSGTLGLCTGGLLLLLGQTLGEDDLVLLDLGLLDLGLSALERAEVAASLETLGRHKSLDLGAVVVQVRGKDRRDGVKTAGRGGAGSGRSLVSTGWSWNGSDFAPRRSSALAGSARKGAEVHPRRCASLRLTLWCMA